MLHILTSIGEFQTDVDLTLHINICDEFKYVNLIGSNDHGFNYRNNQIHCSSILLKSSLCSYLFQKKTYVTFIVAAGELFDYTIVHKSLPITDMPKRHMTDFLNNRMEIFNWQSQHPIFL